MENHSKMYQIFDRIAQHGAGGIIIEPHDAPAIRAYHDALASDKSPFSKHPADYDLVCIGLINQTTLKVTAPTEYPIIVTTGAEWLNTNTNKDA